MPIFMQYDIRPVFLILVAKRAGCKRALMHKVCGSYQKGRHLDVVAGVTSKPTIYRRCDGRRNVMCYFTYRKIILQTNNIRFSVEDIWKKCYSSLCGLEM